LSSWWSDVHNHTFWKFDISFMAPKFILIVTSILSMSDSEMNRPKSHCCFLLFEWLAHRIIQDPLTFMILPGSLKWCWWKNSWCPISHSSQHSCSFIQNGIKFARFLAKIQNFNPNGICSKKVQENICNRSFLSFSKVSISSEAILPMKTPSSRTGKWE
jgi:hypothetical protein